MKIFISFLLLIFIFNIHVYGQDKPDINKYMNKISAGQLQEVKLELLDLLAEYPDDPGVMLLHGMVIDDPYRSLDMYKRIADKYPGSKWADDAYWRIVMFYSVLGDTSQARIFLMKFHQKYPSSEYLKAADDIVLTAVTLARSGKKAVFSAKSTATGEGTMDFTMKKNKPGISAEAGGAKNEPEKPAEEEVMHDIKPESEQENIYKTPGGGGENWGLQVASFSNKDAAEVEKHKYLAQRMRTEVLTKTVDGKELFAVVIGNYTSKESAEAAKQIVEQQCKCKPIVFKK